MKAYCMVQFVRKFAPMAIPICIVCFLTGLGFTYGIAKFRAENYPGTLLNTARFHDQHAMAVALGVYSNKEDPTEAEILRQLRNMMFAYRKAVRLNPYWVKHSDSFDLFCSRLSGLNDRKEANADDVPRFLCPPFISYLRAGSEESDKFLADCRLREKLRKSFDEPIDDLFGESLQTNNVRHTKLLYKVFDCLSKRCPELSYSVENSSIGDVQCLNVAGFMKINSRNSDPNVLSPSVLDFSTVPPVLINIDTIDFSPKSIFESLEREHLISFLMFNTNFVVKIIMQHEKEYF